MSNWHDIRQARKLADPEFRQAYVEERIALWLEQAAENDERVERIRWGCSGVPSQSTVFEVLRAAAKEVRGPVPPNPGMPET